MLAMIEESAFRFSGCLTFLKGGSEAFCSSGLADRFWVGRPEAFVSGLGGRRNSRHPEVSPYVQSVILSEVARIFLGRLVAAQPRSRRIPLWLSRALLSREA